LFKGYLDTIGCRVRSRCLDRGRLVVVAAHRIPAELCGGYGEHSGAGAEVGKRAIRLAGIGHLQQELETEAGGRVGAGAKGAARVDD